MATSTESVRVRITGDSSSATRAILSTEKAMAKIGSTSKRNAATVKSSQTTEANALRRTGTAAKTTGAQFQRLSVSERRAAAESKRHATQLTGTTSKLRSAAKAAGAMVAAYASFQTLKQATSETIDLGKATDRLHTLTGLSIGDASSWVEIAKQRNIQTTQLGMGMITFAKNIQAATRASGTQRDLFNEMGISMKQLQGLNFEQTLELVADRIHALGGGFQRTEAISKLFGRSAQSLAVLFSGGSKEIQKQIGLVHEHGAALDKNELAKVKKVAAAQRELGLIWDGVQKQIALALFDAGTAVAHFVDDVRKGKDGIAKTLHDIVVAFGDVGQAIADVAPGVLSDVWSGIVDSADALIVAIQSVITWTKNAAGWISRAATDFSKFVTSLLPVKAAILLIKVNLYLLYRAFLVLRPGIVAAAKILRTVFGAALRIVSTIIGTFLKTVGNIGSVVGDVVGIVSNLLRGKWGAAWRSAKQLVVDVWHTIADVIKGAWTLIKRTVGGGIAVVKSLVRDGFGAIRDAAKELGDGMLQIFGAIWDKIEGVFVDGANAVIGVLNDLIDLLNKVPFVDIGHIGLIGGSGSGGKRQARLTGDAAKRAHNLQGRARGGEAPNERRVGDGGRVSRPQYVVGEQAPQHPEWVIATNPAYRRDNVKYWAAAGADLGVPGFARGGPAGAARRGDLPGFDLGGLISDGINAVTGAGKSLLQKTVGQALGQSATFLASQIGSAPAPFGPAPKWLAEQASAWLRGETADYGRKHPAATIGGVGGKHGPGGLGTFDGRPVVNWIIDELNYARAHGWRGTITSGYRTRAENAAAGGSPTSKHMEIGPYPAGAVDFGGGYGYWDPVALKNRNDFFRAVGGDPYPGSGIPHGPGPHYTGAPLKRATGFVDWGHASGTGGARGGLVGQLARLGPAALSKLRRFARGGQTVGGVRIAHKLNSIWPTSSGFGDGPDLPGFLIARLAEHFGMPGRAAEQTTRGESSGEPGAVGTDPGGTHGLGLWMITTGYNDATIRRYGGVAAMRNPVQNAKAARDIWRGSSVGFAPPTWYGVGAVTDKNAHYHGKFSDADLVKAIGGADTSGSGQQELTDAEKKARLQKRRQAKRIERRWKQLQQIRAGSPLREFGNDPLGPDYARLNGLARFWHFYNDFDGKDAERWKALEARLDGARTPRARLLTLRAIQRFQSDFDADQISGDKADALVSARGEVPRYDSPGDRQRLRTARAAKLRGLQYRLANANTPERRLGALEAIRDFWTTYGVWGSQTTTTHPGGQMIGLEGAGAPFGVGGAAVVRKSRDWSAMARRLERAAYNPALKDRSHLAAVLAFDRWAPKHGRISGAPEEALAGRIPRFGKRSRPDVAELLRQMLAESLANLRLSQRQYGTLAGFGGYPYVGAFGTGGVVPQTGMALVHKGETVTPPGASPVTIYLSGDLAQAVRVRDAGGSTVLDQQLGRQSRRIRFAPGK